MPREKGSKNLTDKQKKDYNRKRNAVIKEMPRTYNSAIRRYCEEKKIEYKPQSIRFFMAKVTYSEDVMNFLLGFIEFYKSNNQQNTIK